MFKLNVVIRNVETSVHWSAFISKIAIYLISSEWRIAHHFFINKVPLKKKNQQPKKKKQLDSDWFPIADIGGCACCLGSCQIPVSPALTLQRS